MRRYECRPTSDADVLTKSPTHASCRRLDELAAAHALTLDIDLAASLTAACTR